MAEKRKEELLKKRQKLEELRRAREERKKEKEEPADKIEEKTNPVYIYFSFLKKKKSNDLIFI
jgi:DNA-binding protein H-NS